MDTLRVFVRFCESIDAVEPDLQLKAISPTLSDGVGQRDVKLGAEEAEELLEYLGRFDCSYASPTTMAYRVAYGVRPCSRSQRL